MPFPDPINRQHHLLCIHTADVDPIDVGAVIPGLKVWPLYLNSEAGIWVLKVEFQPGVTLPTHFHTGVVHFYQISGEWHYKEHASDVLKPGSYLYEPGGSIHTFHVPADAIEPAVGFMVVEGSNINFTEDGDFVNVMDAGWIEHVVVECAKAQGKTARYIKPAGTSRFCDEG